MQEHKINIIKICSTEQPVTQHHLHARYIRTGNICIVIGVNLTRWNQMQVTSINTHTHTRTSMPVRANTHMLKD